MPLDLFVNKIFLTYMVKPFSTVIRLGNKKFTQNKRVTYERTIEKKRNILTKCVRVETVTFPF